MADTLAMMEDKENFAPMVSSDLLQGRSSSLSPMKPTGSRKGRSKSIGPGGLDDGAEIKRKDSRQEAKNRRKSTYIPTTKAIISADAEKSARQAARRKTLANRRVSFAPEATLHTWDVVEFMRDQTTSTDSSGGTRRGSNVSHNSATSSDEEDEQSLSSPAKSLPGIKQRRSSGIPPMNFNNPDNADSSSELGSDSDASGSEDEQSSEDEEGSQDATGTAMSLDIDDGSLVSSLSDDTSSSTGSSARLDASLRLAAEQAGTRGIDYDEYGDGELEEEASMELAEDAITNAFRPWVEQAGLQQSLGSAALDQENINPFSPAFKADMMSTIAEEETGDISMEMTKAAGGILEAQMSESTSSPLGGVAMDTTQVDGRIYENKKESSPEKRGSQKRRRTTSEAGSPAESASIAQTKKRRRSSVPRSSMGDDTMDLTMAVGSIQSTASTAKTSRRRSMRRRSSGSVSEQADMTMEFTQAIGSIKNAMRTDYTASSFDENEELTMELTTVLGGIREAQDTRPERRTTMPQGLPSPLKRAGKATQRHQEQPTNRLLSSPKELLTPLINKKAPGIAEKSDSADRSKSISPTKCRSSKASLAAVHTEESNDETPETESPASGPTARQIDHVVGRESTLGHAMHTGISTVANEDLTHPAVSPAREATKSPARTLVPATPDRVVEVRLDAESQEHDHEYESSPTAAKQQRSSPVKPTVASSPQVRALRPSSYTSPVSSTPQAWNVQCSSPARPRTPLLVVETQTHESHNGGASTPEQTSDARTIAESIRLMNTPRKETLKNMTPRKQTKDSDKSPQKTITRPQPTVRSETLHTDSPRTKLSEDVAMVQTAGHSTEKIHLQAFLEMAQIRFMELTTTKRRMTTVPTPSKARRDGNAEGEPEVSLETAVVAAACTTPGLEMYRHACHELKHYISDGKKVIKQLESDTYRKTPPLLQAYQQASQDPSLDERRQALDTQMRDMKTHARFRSKTLWYAWRTQLLEDLVKALSGIAEGLIKDDEILQYAEQVVEETLPHLLSRQQTLSLEADRLEQAVIEMSVEDKAALHTGRTRLVDIDDEVKRKQQLLHELKKQNETQRQTLSQMLDTKSEFNAIIQDSERVREACRGVSRQEISALKESITHLEETYGWSITSAETSPPAVTMIYKSQLQLYFHPSSFSIATQSSDRPELNAPIRLNYIAQDSKQNPKELTTTLRFFHQLLRASLQALPQHATRIPDLLNLVSGGWDTALSVAEAERRLNLETPTTARIMSDEQLTIESLILLPAVKTKVCVAFRLLAGMNSGVVKDAGTALSITIEPSTTIVYGQTYNEDKMVKTIVDQIQGIEGWDIAVKDLKSQLIVHGAKKGMR